MMTSELISFNLNLSALEDVSPAVKEFLREVEKAIHQLQRRPPEIIEIPIDRQVDLIINTSEFLSP